MMLDPTMLQRQLPARGSALERRYFTFLKRLPCVVSLRYGVDVAHFRSGDETGFCKPMAGMGIKPRAPYCLPLTHEKHMEQEGMNEWAFWERHGFAKRPLNRSPLALCWTLWGLFNAGHEDVAEQVVIGWNGRE